VRIDPVVAEDDRFPRHGDVHGDVHGDRNGDRHGEKSMTTSRCTEASRVVPGVIAATITRSVASIAYGAALVLAGTVFVDRAEASDFSGFALGSIDGQNGWTVIDSFGTSAGNFDQEIVDSGGQQVWRMSNALATTGFANQPFSPVTPEVAGESGSSLWNDFGTDHTMPLNPPAFGANATTDTFYARVDFRSATGAAQPGLRLDLSPSAKQSPVRMSLVWIVDNGTTGFDLVFWVVEAFVASPGYQFVSTTIATGLSYGDVHSLEMVMTFVDGPENDVVQIFLDGSLVHTGTTWEVYYSLAELINPPDPRFQAVNALLVRSAIAEPSTLGEGIEFLEVEVSNSAPSSSLTITVVLDGTPDPGPFDRCIDFQFGCGGPVESILMTFVNGVGTTTIPMPAGDPTCATARDPKHTLRSTATIVPDGSDFTLDFTGGAGLRGGNLNGDGFIDIIDYAMFAAAYGQNPGADTPCGFFGTHADLDGNGTVGMEDFTFFQINFLKFDQADCCLPPSPAEAQVQRDGAKAAVGRPRERASVAELRALGIAGAERADRNGDGWVDAVDISLFMIGL